MPSKMLKGALVATSALCAFQAAPALAQDMIGEIVVTARRTEERLQDVPISVTVFSQEQIAKQNIVNLTDLALYTPSLGSTNVLGNLQTTFSLRGFNQELTTSATVGVFFADVVAPRGASNQQPAGDGAGPGSFFDLQNVQVLKGPQGTLFGRNTTGGAILLVPQKPTDQLEGYAEGSVGNYGLRRFQGVFNAPLGEQGRVRLGIDRQKRDGYVKNNTNIGPSRFNDVDYTAARFSLVYDISPDLDNYTVASFVHSKTAGESNKVFAAQPAPNLTIPGLGVLPGAVTRPFAYLASRELERYAGNGFYSMENSLANPRTELTQWQVINTTTWRASEDLTVKNIMSYAQLKYDLVSPVIGAAFDLSDFNAFGPAFVALSINPALQARGLPPVTFTPFAPGTIVSFTNADPNGVGHTAHQSTFTEEIQLQGKGLDNRLVWQAGFYFEDSRPLGMVGSLSSPLLICQQVYFCAAPFFGSGSLGLTESQKKIRTVGVYSQASYDLTEQLKFTAGLRYTWDRQETTGDLRTFTIPYDPYLGGIQYGAANPATCTLVTASIANNCTETLKQKSDAPTWLVGLDFKPTDDILTYAKYSRGYRTGGISFQVPTALRIYGPEKVDSYEVGLKASFNGAVRGNFNVAAFYNDFRNQQVPINLNPRVAGAAAPATAVLNAGKSRIYGLEVDSAVELFDGFIASLGYSYLNTKIKKIAYPAFNDPIYLMQTNRAPRVGDPLPYAPKHKLSVSLAYTLPLDEDIGEVTLGATYTHTARQITSYWQRDAAGKLGGFSDLQPRDLLDLNLTWNKVAGSPVDLAVFANNVTQRKYFTYILDFDQGFQGAQLGLPRMYGMRLRYTFGN